MRRTGAWLLIIFGGTGMAVIVAHVICNDLGVCAPGVMSGPYLAILGFRIDCFTWWGKGVHLLIDGCFLSGGIWMLRNPKRTNPKKPSTATE